MVVGIIALDNAEVAGTVERVRFFPQLSPAVLSQNLIFIQRTYILHSIALKHFLPELLSHRQKSIMPNRVTSIRPFLCNIL